MTIVSKSAKAQVFGGRKKKRATSKKVKRRNTESKIEEKELRSYYLENDFGTENSDDVYLSRLNENY